MVSAPLTSIAGEPDSKARLRLWIRLLRASRLIEGVARERLKTQFNATLPRFDVMAALYRKPDGMLMSEISRFLMVSNGNVTGIVDRLVADGFVARSQRNGDRRTSFISLTRKGRSDVCRNGGGAWGLGRRTARRRFGARSRADVDEAEIVSQRLGGRSMGHNMAAPDAQALSLAHGRRRRRHPAEPA